MKETRENYTKEIQVETDKEFKQRITIKKLKFLLFSSYGLLLSVILLFMILVFCTGTFSKYHALSIETEENPIVTKEEREYMLSKASVLNENPLYTINLNNVTTMYIFYGEKRSDTREYMYFYKIDYKIDGIADVQIITNDKTIEAGIFNSYGVLSTYNTKESVLEFTLKIGTIEKSYIFEN